MQIYHASPDLKPFSGIPSPSRTKPLLFSRTAVTLHGHPTFHLSPLPSFLPTLQPWWTTYRSPVMPRCPPLLPRPAEPMVPPTVGLLYTLHHTGLPQVAYPPRISPGISHLTSHCLLEMLLTAPRPCHIWRFSLVFVHEYPVHAQAHNGHSAFGKWMNEEFLTLCYRYKMVLYRACREQEKEALPKK